MFGLKFSGNQTETWNNTMKYKKSIYFDGNSVVKDSDPIT